MAVAVTSATPEAPIVAAELERLALAPPAGAVNVTMPPCTGSPNALLEGDLERRPEGGIGRSHLAVACRHNHHEAPGLEGTDIDRAAFDPRVATLVGGGRDRVVAGFDRRAARQQGEGRRRAAVVPRWRQQRVGAADDPALEAVIPLDQVIGTRCLRPVRGAVGVEIGGSAGTTGEDRIVQDDVGAGDGDGMEVEDRTSSLGCVSGESRIGDRKMALVVEDGAAGSVSGRGTAPSATAALGTVVIERAIRDGHRPLVIEDGAAQAGAATPSAMEAASPIHPARMPAPPR